MQEDSLETVTPIAVVCALDRELAHLRFSFARSREEWRSNRRFWLTELGGQPIVLNVCGMGMLSAAAAEARSTGK